VEQAYTEELFNHPYHPYTKGLIKSIPAITKEKHRLEEIKGMVPNPTEKIIGCSFCPRCDKAVDICKEQEPILCEVEENHLVRCWLYQ